jgi:hypothetical protein
VYFLNVPLCANELHKNMSKGCEISSLEAANISAGIHAMQDSHE